MAQLKKTLQQSNVLKDRMHPSRYLDDLLGIDVIEKVHMINLREDWTSALLAKTFCNSIKMLIVLEVFICSQ